MTNETPILEVQNLKKYYETEGSFIDNILGRSQEVRAVDGVGFALQPGETLGVVGESGCGKTTLGRAIVRLIEPTSGTVQYRPDAAANGSKKEPVELTELSSRELRSLRTDIQYIFQDPFSSLNPRMTVGDIIGEPLEIHDVATGAEKTSQIHELLQTVGLNPSHAYRYPSEFSGGQRQRIGIARALAVNPEVIICDEPVSALDVSVQAQILNLLEDLQDEYNLSYVFIAHDLSVVEHISDRIAVMYLGEFVEVAPTDELFNAPKHPYTQALLSVIPEPDPLWEGEKIFLEGDVPSPKDPPSGCRFHTRCPKVIPPDELGLRQGEWRSVLNLKLRLQQKDSVSAVVEAESGLRSQADLASATNKQVDDAVRAEFDIPASLSDPEAEQVLTDAVEQLREAGPAAAQARLSETFVSPCEETRPEQITVTERHNVSCLLHNNEYADVNPTVQTHGPGVNTSTDD